MKKQLARLLSAALLLLALCIGASAAGTSGKCGPSAYWSFDSGTGTLTISGSGAMSDYVFEWGESDPRPWSAYLSEIKTVVIGDSITEIGKEAFYGYSYYGSGTLGAYFLGAAPQLVGTVNANCSFPSDWTLYYLPGTSGWTGEAYEGYRIAPWDGETRWDNLRTSKFGYGLDNKGNEIETSWSVNTDTGKITLTDDLNEGCAVAVSYDAEGRVTRIGVLRTREDSAVLSLQDTCRLFLLSASFAPRLNAPVIINDYLPI